MHVVMGDMIRRRRVILGLTQQELADYAGVSVRMLVALENGKANPSLKILEALASVLGMDVTLKVKEIDS